MPRFTSETAKRAAEKRWAKQRDQKALDESLLGQLVDQTVQKHTSEEEWDPQQAKQTEINLGTLSSFLNLNRLPIAQKRQETELEIKKRIFEECERYVHLMSAETLEAHRALGWEIMEMEKVNAPLSES